MPIVYIPVATEGDGQPVEIKTCAVTRISSVIEITEIALSLLIVPTSSNGRVTVRTRNDIPVTRDQWGRGVCFGTDPPIFPVRVYYQDESNAPPVHVGRIDLQSDRHPSSGRGVAATILARLPRVIPRIR